MIDDSEKMNRVIIPILRGFVRWLDSNGYSIYKEIDDEGQPIEEDGFVLIKKYLGVSESKS